VEAASGAADRPKLASSAGSGAGIPAITVGSSTGAAGRAGIPGISGAGSEAVVAELTSQLTSTQHLLANKTTALAESEEGLADAAHRERSAALAMVESVQKVEDIESVTASCYSLLDTCTRLESVDWDLVPSTAAQLAGLAWVLGRGAANTCPDLEHAARLTRATAGLAQQAAELLSAPSGSSERLLEAVAELRRAGQAVLQSLGAESDLADLVALEISAMDAAIEEASRKIEELLEASRKQDSGAKLEVNEAVLDSCTGLVRAIRELVNKSKQLQSEIMAERGAGLTDREFYKKNSRWTEGLISAAKAVGLGAKLLVDAADRVVLGSGKFEEIMVASQEIAASTAQLTIASRVKAREGSNKFHELKLASKVVTEATGAVVAVAKSSSVTIENVDLDISGLSAHQTKTLEMNVQVRLLTLESQLETERTKLAQLRRQHYKDGADGVEQ